MKFILNTHDLVNALSVTTHALSPRTTMPILEGVLLEASEEGLRVTCSDGAMTISFTGDSAFSYHLLATDSLSPTNWYDYGGTNVGADALQSFEIPIDSEHPQRFFKIEVIRK